jgi:poly(3-hydroxybutyrate) depolymerase
MPSVMKFPVLSMAGVSNITLLVHDPNFGPVNRTFLLSAPSNPVNSQRGARLLLAFHGQGGRPKGLREAHSFDSLADNSTDGDGVPDPWIVAYLQGMADFDRAGVYNSGWNCGTAPDNSPCIENATNNYCHQSCAALNECGRCTWSTCYDDVAFVSTLLGYLAAEFVIDEERIFAYGESNGGMFVHYLAQQLPGRLRGIVPVYGHPLLGYLVGKDFSFVSDAAAAARTDLFDLQPRSDRVIPLEGGLSTEGWLYEPLEKVVGVWRTLHGCDASLRELPTPWSERLPQPLNLSCWAHANCSTGRVQYCECAGSPSSSWLTSHLGEAEPWWRAIFATGTMGCTAPTRPSRGATCWSGASSTSRASRPPGRRCSPSWEAAPSACSCCSASASAGAGAGASRAPIACSRAWQERAVRTGTPRPRPRPPTRPQPMHAGRGENIRGVGLRRGVPRVIP